MEQMTVTSIVQRLLDEGKITAEEAVVLLKAEVLKSQTNPIVITQPNITTPSTQPYTPYIPHSPFIGDPPYTPGHPPNYPPFWYSSGTTGKGLLNNDNLTGTLNDFFKKDKDE